MKILHFITDEKFPDAAYEAFEKIIPGKSTYMLPGRSAPIKYLKKIVPIRVRKYSFLSASFIKSISQYDVVVFHALHPFSLEILARLKPETTIVWIGMGYDYYDILNNSHLDLFKPDTKKLVGFKAKKLVRNPVDIFRKIVDKIVFNNVRNKEKLVKKVDLWAPVLSSEYGRLKEKLGEPFPEHVQWNYGVVAGVIDGPLANRVVTGKNILVGNSASPNNNHIEMFRVLYEMGIPDDSALIVPLSYGDFVYRDNVIKEGQALFGERFKPITEFMPLNEYVDLLASCSTVIMNHLRQQAAGNLYINLFLGSRVYLDLKNPLYEEFRTQGLAVESINDLKRDREVLNTPMMPELIKKNKEILKMTRGRSAHAESTKKFIEQISRKLSEKKD